MLEKIVILPHCDQLFRCYIYPVYCIPLIGEPEEGLPEVINFRGGRSTADIALVLKIHSFLFLKVIIDMSCKLTVSKQRFSSKNSLFLPLLRSRNLKLAQIFGACPHYVSFTGAENSLNLVLIQFLYHCMCTDLFILPLGYV